MPAPRFAPWYRLKLGRLPVWAQAILWFVYGFIWIPAWYFSTRHRSIVLPGSNDPSNSSDSQMTEGAKAHYADDPSLGAAERIQRAVRGLRLRDLPSFGAEGLEALVACLSSRAGLVPLSAAGVLTDKSIASQATPALAAALDDPAAVYARADALGLLSKLEKGRDPKTFVYTEVLGVLAHRGDERAVPAVLRLCQRNDEYSEAAIGALERMLSRKRVYAHLTNKQLNELAVMPDLTQAILGQEADRFETTVYWGNRTLSCEAVRVRAQTEMDRRAQWGANARAPGSPQQGA